MGCYGVLWFFLGVLEHLLAPPSAAHAVVHKKEINILFIQYIYFCVKINVLHVNWNLTIAYSFLNTVVYTTPPHILTYLSIALPQQATVNVYSLHITQMYCTNVNVFIQHYTGCDVHPH